MRLFETGKGSLRFTTGNCAPCASDGNEGEDTRSAFQGAPVLDSVTDALQQRGAALRRRADAIKGLCIYWFNDTTPRRRNAHIWA